MNTKHFHERVESGWNIRNGDGVLIAIVPDMAHVRESDARRVVEALDLHEKKSRSARARRRR
jgi:hypothetical protein